MSYGINRNQEGYTDPTAYHAMRSIMAQEASEEQRLNALLVVLKYIINLAGFSLAARIELRGKETGRLYK